MRTLSLFFSLLLSHLGDPLTPCTGLFSLYDNVAIAAMWPIVAWIPHVDSTCSLQAGVWIPQHSHGLQLRRHTKLARCRTVLYFNTEHKLWTLSFVSALPRTQLDFFSGKTDRDGTWGSQEGSPPSFYIINKVYYKIPPSGSQEILFLATLQELIFHWQQLYLNIRRRELTKHN